EECRDLVQLVTWQRRPPWRRHERKQPVPGLRRERTQGRSRSAAQWTWHHLEHTCEPLRPEVAVIAGEQLVPAVARQRHGHMLAGQFGNEIGRYLRGIGERLIEPGREMWNDLERMSRLDIKLSVIGAQMGGDLLRTLGFIIAAFVKADREGLHRPRALCLH